MELAFTTDSFGLGLTVVVGFDDDVYIVRDTQVW